MEAAISHSAWKHEQFAAVRGVGVCGDVWDWAIQVPGAGQAVGIIFCPVSCQAQSGNHSQYLSLLWHLGQKWQETSAWLSPGAVSQGCPSGAIQGALGLLPAPHQEETSRSQL